MLVRGALVIVGCMLATACATTGPDPRPLERGFAVVDGVADPYEDGKKHLAAGRYETAIDRFGQLLSTDRGSLEALNGLAVAYAGLGRFDVAQSYFERALQIEPTDARTLNNYGWSLIEQGRLRDAKPFLELALHYAEDRDVAAIDSNVEGMGRARPPALVGVLEGEARADAPGGQRLLRVAANVYRLETDGAPGRHDAVPTAEGDLPDRSRPIFASAPFVLTESVAAPRSREISAEPFPAPETDPDLGILQSGGAPTVSRVEPGTESEAAAVVTGDET